MRLIICALLRLGVLFLLGTLVGAGCHAPRAGLMPRGVSPASSTQEALDKALQPRRVALLIGVDRYDSPSLPNLRFAVSDAIAMAEFLRSDQGGFDRVVVVGDDEAASRDAIVRQLQSIAADLRPDDVFVAYFSGHGTLTRDDGGQPELFLLPSDSDPGAVRTTALELEALRAYFSRLVTEQKALIVDACFHGQGKSAVSPGASPISPQDMDWVSQSAARGLGAGEAHLFASTLGRPAYEDPNLGHGVYTHYLLQAMSWLRGTADKDGDGLLTAWEAHDYARARVIEHTEGLQIPEASLRVVGERDLILSGTASTRNDRRKALLFQYGGAQGRYTGYTLVVDGQAKGVFPGTFVVPPGPHHIELRDPDGGRALDGYTVFKPGQTLGAANLGVALREDRFLQAFRLGAGSGSPAMSVLWGDSFLAAEWWAALRVPRGLGRGLFVGSTVGAAVSPTRRDLERLIRRGRGAFWLAGEVGWGFDQKRMRIRGAWQLRGTLVPVAHLDGPDSTLEPEEAGWLFGSTGPSVHLGVILDRRLALVGVGTIQVTGLDPNREGIPRPLFFGAVTFGLELGL